jgi:hypothetical protein
VYRDFEALPVALFKTRFFFFQSGGRKKENYKNTNEIDRVVNES